MKTTGSRWINTPPDRNEGKLLLSNYDPKKNPLNDWDKPKKWRDPSEWEDEDDEYKDL